MKRKRKVYESIHLMEASAVGVPAYPTATLSYEFKDKEEEEMIEKKKLTYEQREELPSSAFVYPKEKRYPIHDRAHAQNALARVSAHGTPEEKAKVIAAVCRRYSDLPTCQERKGKGIESEVPTLKELKQMEDEIMEKQEDDEETETENTEETEEETEEEEEKSTKIELSKEMKEEIIKEIVKKVTEKLLEEKKVENKGLASTETLRKNPLTELKYDKDKHNDYIHEVAKQMVARGFMDTTR